MLHLPHLIQDLAVILITAAVTTILFRAFKQPLVLGYLLAGFLVSPQFSFFPTIMEGESIQVWAEIGVIFLLFGLGLEFSFRKLLRVGPSASITAVVEVVFMLSLGFLTGRWLGWSIMDSLFLGGILSISSTTIIIRAIEEWGMKGRGFVSLIFAVLVVEDLVAILLLVLLSTLAATQTFEGAELLESGLRLGFFLILWFIAGVYFLPTLFQKIRRFLSDETTLIVAIGMCLGMVALATSLGFSPALGAFVMGSLIAETREARKVEHILKPVRDLFAAIFFVSVGMLIDPKALVEHGPVILLITGITIFGKFFSTSMGALVSGQSLRHSVQAGMSLAQIGEFSFIIATAGLTLKVTSPFLYPIAVAVSAVTTFTTPYLIRSADPFYGWIEKTLSPRVLRRLSEYHQNFTLKQKEGFLMLIWRQMGFPVLFSSVVVVALALGVRRLVTPETRVLFGFVVLFLSLPFLWAISIRQLFVSDPTVVRTPLVVSARVASAILRIGTGLFLIGMIFYQYVGFGAAAIYLVIGVPILIFLGNRYAKSVYKKIEKRFRQNLNETEEEAKPALAPWDANLANFTLSHNSEFVAKTLLESKLRERFGVIVAMIERGGRSIFAPTRQEMLFPHDHLYLIGTDEEIARVQPLIEAPEFVNNGALVDFKLEPILLGEESPYVGKPIRDSGLREETQGLVVGIERDGQRLLNPDSTLALQAGDLLWIVGDRSRILKLRI